MPFEIPSTIDSLISTKSTLGLSRYCQHNTAREWIISRIIAHGSRTCLLNHVHLYHVHYTFDSIIIFVFLSGLYYDSLNVLFVTYGYLTSEFGIFSPF